MIRKITNILLVLAMVFGFNIFKTDFFGVETAKAENAALAISISQDKTLMLEGDTTPIKATVNVKNTSSVVADHVRIDLPIAGNMTVDESSINEDGQFLGDKIVWLLPDMATGAKFDLTYKFQLGITPVVQKYYVATDGKDSNAGTLEAPLKTILGARDKIVKDGGVGKIGKPVEVNIRAGRYYFDDFVGFGADDSGTSQYPITYKNYGDDEVVFVGGSKVSTSWEPVSGKDYWKTNIGTATKPNNLIVDDAQATLAKDPNNGSNIPYYIADSFITSLDQTTPLESLSKPNCEYIKRDAQDTSSLSTNQTDVRVHAYMRWTETTVPIKSINTTTGIIKTYPTIGGEDPSIFGCYNGGYADIEETKGKVRYTLENVFEKLDVAGEWYFDSSNGDLYYYPIGGKDPNTSIVEASKTSTILYFANTSYINVQGIKFIGTQTAYGFTDMQGAIIAENTSHLKITGNKFYGTGTNGINVNPSSNAIYSNILIQKNTFDSIGFTPVQMFGNMDTNKKITANYSAIINNKFINSGTIKTTQVVNLSNVAGSLIENNDIDGGGYAGIRASYSNTGDKGIPVDNVTFASNLPLTVISKNRVKNVMQKLNDGGGIYAYHARNIPVSIDNNIVSDLVATDFHYDNKENFVGIYLDEGQSNTSVTNNLVYNTSYGIDTNMSGVNNRVVNNILAKIIKYGFYASYITQIEYDGGTTPRKDYPNEKMLIKNNVFDFADNPKCAVDPDISNNPECIKFMMARQMIRYSGQNLLVPSIGDSKNIHDDRDGWNAYDFASVAGELSVESNSKSDNPQFVDPGADKLNNFSLKSDSPAFGLGFKAIDFSKVGPNW